MGWHADDGTLVVLPRTQVVVSVRTWMDIIPVIEINQIPELFPVLKIIPVLYIKQVTAWR
jgi:hypothetical protein